MFFGQIVARAPTAHSHCSHLALPIAASRTLVPGLRRSFGGSTANAKDSGDLSAPYTGKYSTLEFSNPKPHLLQVTLNRPSKGNCFNSESWSECGEAFKQISDDPKVRAVVLAGNGKHFCTGIDLMDFMQVAGGLMQMEDVGRRCLQLRKIIKKFQSSYTAIADCAKPVIAAVHGACIGGAIDMITACDIRLGSKDSVYSVKEVDIGLAADVGTLQRIGKVVGNDSWVREICLTARTFEAEEAAAMGLLSKVAADKDAVLADALELGGTIAAKSPVAVQSTKEVLNHSRDHTVKEGLDYVAMLNMGMLCTEDIAECQSAMMSKSEPKFNDIEY
eukprot:Nk52_evm35s2462 gene=Nk52_evmTU35s2462